MEPLIFFFNYIFFFKPLEPPKEDKLEDKRQNGGHGGQIGPMEDVLLNGGQLCTMHAGRLSHLPTIYEDYVYGFDQVPSYLQAMWVITLGGGEGNDPDLVLSGRYRI